VAVRHRPHEAYVTFLSSAKNREYYEGVRLLLFQLKHDPLTLDPSDRDFVVITTEKTPPEMELELLAEGAIIHRQDLITGLPMGTELDGTPFDQFEDHRWIDVYTKLSAWNMTEYERVLLLDSDIMLLKSLHSVWDDRNSWPASGLAGCSDWWGTGHDTPIPDHGKLNSGFMLLQPDKARFEDLLRMRDFDPHEGDQASASSQRCSPHNS
jgi:alpha-N-acetylglucosamine transferase